MLSLASGIPRQDAFCALASYAGASSLSTEPGQLPWTERVRCGLLRSFQLRQSLHDACGGVLWGHLGGCSRQGSPSGWKQRQEVGAGCWCKVPVTYPNSACPLGRDRRPRRTYSVEAIMATAGPNGPGPLMGSGGPG